VTNDRVPAPKPDIDKFDRPHNLPIHLPTPGEDPPWPFHNIGQWKINVDDSVEVWRQGFKVWREEHLIRIGYDDSQYCRKELLWTQSNYVHAQMMVEDRYFYDSELGRYTVNKYLDDLESRFGGIDSVLIWYVYPNIGVDDRSQHDLVDSLPGGVEGLKKVVSEFHRRNVKVFLPTMPWDNGTKDSGKKDWQAVCELAEKVKADGINGDTYFGVPYAFREASDNTGHPVALQPETWSLSDEALIWNNQSWGKASTSFIPAVSKLKWLEPRHLTNVENRWARDRTDDFQYIFFNGHGYNAWENIWGIWNQLTPRDSETLRRISSIFRKFNNLLISRDWEPYFPTLQKGVFATRFPDQNLSLWTVVNRNEYEIDEEQLAIDHEDRTRYFDLWSGVELNPRFDSKSAIISFNMEPKGYGCVLSIKQDEHVEGLEEFLKMMKSMAAKLLKEYSSSWNALPQKMVDIRSTQSIDRCPKGMVDIPRNYFDFKVEGIEIEGYRWAGLDFQYPWETLPRRSHFHHMEIKRFFIDRYPVTNDDYYQFIRSTSYYPEDDYNFLKDWVDGKPKRGWENKPVTWVSIEDARAYAGWAGKRLPNEWEWQYAAQGTDGRLFPWGNSWDADAVPEINKQRHLVAPDDVDAHPTGASPFGVADMVGNVWQWTNEFYDEHTRAASLRGGSSYQPETSHWYFPQAYQLDQHGKYLMMAPCKDRSGMIGFRCVVDGSDS
jgi:formylglycine-generating enzyme required for sulfatase activity|tara:strand:- start:3399 stop:5558 length:2160 start_codon:yes stop_codon:yes gene_type:complete